VARWLVRLRDEIGIRGTADLVDSESATSAGRRICRSDGVKIHFVVGLLQRCRTYGPGRKVKSRQDYTGLDGDKNTVVNTAEHWKGINPVRSAECEMGS
jgi:hypothetical protein